MRPTDWPLALAPAAVVLDTNAALDWLAFSDPRIAPLARAIERADARWLATPLMRAEFSAVLERPALAHIEAYRRERALTLFDGFSAACAEPGAVGDSSLTCRDPDDQVFIELAIASRARWLVTRDKALLALRRPAGHLGLAIIVPEAWSGI